MPEIETGEESKERKEKRTEFEIYLFVLGLY